MTPSYLTSTASNYTNNTYTDTNAIAVTPLIGNGSSTDLYVVRHSAYNSNDSTPYKFTVTSSAGNITIPQLAQLSDHLTLNGRDSKVHVVDYDVGGVNLLYSSAEIFTWQKYDTETVLVLYGGENETHEFAVPTSGCALKSGSAGSFAVQSQNGHDIVQWTVTPEDKTIQCGNLTIYALWRNSVYNWWVLELPATEPLSNYSSLSKTSVIIGGGYLMRTARIENNMLYLTGDVNDTSIIHVAGSPAYSNINFNGKDVGTSPCTLNGPAPTVSLPNLSQSTWYSIDSLPELSQSYSDAAWTRANKTQTFNQFQPDIPEVLYADEYGYHSGSLLYRGHFTAPASGSFLDLSLYTQGGQAYGYSVFLNSTSVYQYPGYSTSQNHNTTISLSGLAANQNYIVTILIDHMGLTENFNPGNDTMREPRGLLSYNLTGPSNSKIPVAWKLTGNLGGEQYIDKTRGPLNEGSMFFERQGYHLPGAPVNNTSIFTAGSSPLGGFAGPGVRFYATEFTLDLPTPEYDIPLAFVFTNVTGSSGTVAFRCQLYVNGFQFGKYVNHIGPQLAYPVPEGILNYNGNNYVGVSLWNMEDGNETVGLGSFELRSSSTPVLSGLGKEIGLSYELPQDGWSQRQGAY